MKLLFVQQTQEPLNAFVKKAVFGDHQIVAFPAQGQKFEVEDSSHGPDRRRGVRPAGQDFEADIQVSAEFTGITGNLFTLDAGLL